MIQSISVSSIKNARELGGYITMEGKKIKDGVLLRTANLNGISAEDIRTLTDIYHLEHIIDFRMPIEMRDDAYPAISSAKYHHLDVIDQATFIPKDAPEVDMYSIDIVQMLGLAEQIGMLNEKLYIGFLTSDFGKKAYAEFFRILLGADPERAVLWHCTSGKDRTGLAAMLLLSALGADEELIVDDYLLTNEYNERSIEGTKQYLKEKGYDDAVTARAILVFDAVDERYMRNAIGELKKEYGSVIGYIHDGLHITQEEIDSIKEKYLV